jgi:hypothetical protein
MPNSRSSLAFRSAYRVLPSAAYFELAPRLGHKVSLLTSRFHASSRRARSFQSPAHDVAMVVRHFINLMRIVGSVFRLSLHLLLIINA